MLCTLVTLRGPVKGWIILGWWHYPPRVLRQNRTDRRQNGEECCSESHLPLFISHLAQDCGRFFVILGAEISLSKRLRRRRRAVTDLPRFFGPRLA